MKVIYYTHTGRVRISNEDGLLVGEVLTIEPMSEPEIYLESADKLCVADGMGGSRYGEVATKTFLSLLQEVSVQSTEDIDIVVRQTQKTLQGIDTGCAVAGLILGEEPFVFNIGDCRVYKKEGIFLNKLTRDHSVVQQLIDSGEITEEEALVHPRNHILTSALTPTSTPEIYVKKIKVPDKAIYLLCTDGLWGEFGIDELESCFESDVLEEIDQKIQTALKNKSLKDNISYILVEV